MRILLIRTLILPIALTGLLSTPLTGLLSSGLFSSASQAKAAVTSVEDREEVFLSFRYRGVGDVVVIAMYEDGNIYLPVTELFNRLGIFYQTDTQNLRVHGHYLTPVRPYIIHFGNRTATLEGVRTSFTADDMIVDELDFYLLPEVLEEVFGLDFTIDMSSLVLRLQTTETMPVVDRLERRQRRERIELGIRTRQLHPTEFERNRRLVGGGFLDYSLTGNLSTQANSYNYTAGIGAEALGGDIQGNLFGSWTGTTSNFTTSGLRWRYVFEDQPWLTQTRVGQHRTEGPHSRRFRGVHLTNQPVEPRRTLDEFVFDGTAPPDSEVELFINNRLVDFQEVDELGNYRFAIPMTYGTSQVRIMVYEPDGQIREQDRRIQVPFTFLPPGELNYHFSAGQMDQLIFGMGDYSNLVSANASYGIYNWLTAHAGGEYLSEYHNVRPHFFAGASARLLDQYLVNLDLAPDAFYRLTSGVVYPNSMSWNVGYTYYTSTDGLYNVARNDYELNANVFVPVTIRDIPFNFRISANRQDYSAGSNNRFRGDIGVRFGRINIRGGYRDTYRYAGGNLISTDGRITTIATYSAPRTRTTPGIIRGTYLRGQIDYSRRLNQVERVDMQLTRSIFGNGRLRIAFGRNLVGKFNIVEGSLTFDFNRTRSTTTARSARNAASIRQNVRGSIGYDDYHNQWVFEDRQQVGRAAASVRLFVDRNDSGTFDEGDELIRANALRLDRAGTARLHNDGVVRITQIQQYYRNNMEINLGSIPNPMLVPVIREFSFVADPNRFKPMDIPFYMSGVLDGMVWRYRDDERRGQGGIRVMLRQIDGDFRETMRTFSDGSFYAMEIPPGRYEAWIDTTQQEFLNAVSDPAIRRFEVQALADGDFVENLDFTLYPRRVIDQEPADEGEVIRDLASGSQNALRLYVKAHQAFRDRDYRKSYELIEQSLEAFETDYGLILKGSLLYLYGQEEEAQEYWGRARERNPEAVIPETRLLDLMIGLETEGSLELSVQQD